jgi:hypothetical protein
VAIVRERYADFGPTLAAEKLAEEHGLTVSRETLRKWMSDAGVWLSRQQRRTFHQPRLRRESYGELMQIDGSEHRWFEDRGGPCTLLVFIDDATGKLQKLRVVKSESTFSYFEALEFYLTAHGCPVAFYSNKRLGEVLSWIKSEQDASRPAPRVKTNSEQVGYQKRGRKPGRRTDFMNDPSVIARRQQSLSQQSAAE